MAKSKKRTKKYDQSRAERILNAAHLKQVYKEMMKPLRGDLVQHYQDLMAVHAFKMVNGVGTSVSLDVLCFFGILSKNLAQLSGVKVNFGDDALGAIQGAAETAYYKNITTMDLSTGQKKTLLALNEFCAFQIASAPTAYFVDAYKHAQKCVVDMNRKGGIVASFGEMPEWGQPYLTYENFKMVIKQAKESIESESTMRYKINLYSLDYDEEASKLAEDEKMALDQRLFVTGQTIESIPLSTLGKSEEKKAKKAKKSASSGDSSKLKARERLFEILEQLPMIFTSTSAENTARPTYASGNSFVHSAKNQGDMIQPTGKKIGQAVEYINVNHEGYQDWLVSRERKSKKVSGEIRA